MWHVRGLLTVVAAGALILGCSSTDADSDESGASADTVAADAAGSASGQDEQGSTGTDSEKSESGDNGAGTDEESDDSFAASTPLGAFFSDDGGIEAALANYRVKVERGIQICMAEQGFEFVPTGATVSEVDRAATELTRREWTEKYGYGISTSLESALSQVGTDPNVEIFFSLQPAEREIWEETLAGVADLDPNADNPTGQTPLEDQGCIGAAIIETGGQEVYEDFQSFEVGYDEGLSALRDRPDMIQAESEWSRCMAEAGYPEMVDVDRPEEVIGGEFDTIVSPLIAQFESLDEDEAEAVFSGAAVELDSIPGFDANALRDLQEKELTLASIDLDCYEQHVEEIFQPLINDFENGLITEYGGQFGQLRELGS